MTEKSQSQIDGFQKHRIFKIPRFILISGVLLFPLLVMAACSWVPDELDVTSYLWGDDAEEYILDSSSSNILAENTASSIDSSSDLFDDDPDAWLESDDDFPILSNEDDFPNDKLKNTNSASVEEGLLAERATSRYTDTTLRSRYAEGPTDEKWNEDPYTEPLVVISEDQDIKSLDQNISRPKSKSSAGIIVNVEEIERLRANNSHLEDSSNLPNEIDQFRSTFNERFLASGGLGSSNKLDSKVTDFSNDIHDNQMQSV